jgi:signal transduction histidine kinase
LSGRLRGFPFIRRRSLGNGLALLFFAVTALSLAVLFFVVVPQLESSLERQQLRDIGRRAAVSSPTLERAMRTNLPSDQLDELVRAVADSADAQVTVLGVQQSNVPTPEPRFFVISDSAVERDVVPDRSLAATAVLSGGNRVYTAVGEGSGGEAAQAARQLYYFGRPNWVALYSRDLDDVAEAVSLVGTRMAVASALALIVALLGAYLVAGRLARRVRRLEDAAREVAEGREVAPIRDPVDDELGRLSRTFDDMQQQLARIDRARRDFIANASHELRTPLFSLGGFVELLHDEDLDERTRQEFLASMREQVERLQKLSVDLLDLSQLDAGSLALRPERVDLAALARDVLAEFEPTFVRRGCALDLRLPDRGVDAWCDPARTAQILRILVDNALRHTPEGTRVSVSARWQTGSCELTVADDGPGVGREGDAREIFDRFFTADGAGGSGLGLAIARELAEHMNGGIEVRSRPGHTAFTLLLPAAGPPEPSAERVTPAGAPGRPAEPPEANAAEPAPAAGAGGRED